MPNSDADNLIRLFHRKWSVRVLAEMARTSGSRAAVLRNRLGIAPGALRQTLDHLIELGLVVPNPGTGHPLRPEYVLTPAGETASEACARIESSSRRLGLSGLMQRKWSMPVLWAVSDEPLRFTEIAGVLDPITDRALSQSLVRLEGARLIRPVPLDVRPPAHLYALETRGRTLANALRDLAA